MNVRKPILLITFLLAWLGGVGSVWADNPDGVYGDSQEAYNTYVKYRCGSHGFDIQFKLNGTGDWLKTTYGQGGYYTKLQVNGGTVKSLYSSFSYGTPYTVDGIKVSIDASIADATTKAVTIQYNIENTNDYDVTLKIGSHADTQVGSDDHASITRVGHNTIMMTASGGAMYGITAGTEEFTTLWYGYYGDADDNVFNDNGGVYQGTSTDSGLAWSWTVSLPAHGTKIIAFGGLASQKGAVSMSGYRYGETPSTPSVSGVEGNPTINYYYNTSDSNTGGTAWSSVTGTTLSPGKYYIYAEVGATSTTAAMTTPTTPFTVSKGEYNMSAVSFADGSFTYDGTAKSLAISGTLPTNVSVNYTNNSRTNAGSQTVTANFTTTNSNYNNPASKNATLTVNKATPLASDFAYTPPSNLVYNGTPKTATVTTNLTGGKTGMGAVTVKYYKGTTLLPSAPKDAGTYTVKIDVAEGTNYASASNLTNNWTFTISPKAITSSDITVTVDDATYTGQRQTPVITVKDGTTVLTNNTDYTISYKGSRLLDAQTYVDEIIITGKGNYTGTREEDFTINPKAFDGTYTDDFTISAVPTQIYDGTNAVNPSVSVFDKDVMLIKDLHYTITYGGNNTEGVGTGTITITGLDSYSGSKIFHFDIVNEYFTEGNFTYHATSPTTVAVGNQTHTAATTLTGAVEIPATVTHVVATPFQVTGIEEGAFRNKTDVTGISMPHETLYLEYIENKAFEGCTNLRYIDLCHATGFTPSSLERHIAASPFYDVPKQALVYLNSTTFIGENYVYKPGNSTNYYCKLFKVYDDISGSQTAFSETNGYRWEFENRHDFTAYTVENTRMLTAGKHYTVCLPYDLPLPSTLKAYKPDGVNSAKTLIGFTEVTGTLGPTGTPDWLPVPYVVIPSVSGQLLNATNTLVHEFKEDVTNKTTLNGVTTGSFTFYGTMRYMEGTDATGLYIMQYNNGNPTWMQIAAGSGFNQSNSACVLPMRAYIKNTVVAGAPPYLNATFTDVTGVTTTVMPLRLDENDAEEWIYDLSGRRVTTPRKGTVYIINHRKVRK